MLILPANSLTGGYEIANSLRFNSGSDDYLSRTPASASNRQIWTYSCWVKRTVLGNFPDLLSAGGDGTEFYFLDANQLQFYYYSGGFVARIQTTQLFRDVSAWYHIVLAVDTTQATSSDRIKIYVNGSQVTTFNVSTYPPQNTNMDINNTTAHYIGRYGSGASGVRNGDYYLSETYLIDGQQLDPTSFGEFDQDSGIWKPIKYTGTYGTNGFYLDFENSGSLGTDQSGNGNNFTVNNLTSIDQVTDSPTNNYATGNPLYRGTNNNLFSDGNLTFTGSGEAYPINIATYQPSAGKWYWETKPTTIVTATLIGMAWNGYTSGGTGRIIYYPDGTILFPDASSASTTTYTTGDIIGCALDLDSATTTLKFYKNGTLVYTYNNVTTGLEYSTRGEGMIFWQLYTNDVVSVNFGNPPFTISSGNSDANGYGNFEYSVPSGYYALNTKNLAEFG